MKNYRKKLLQETTTEVFGARRFGDKEKKKGFKVEMKRITASQVKANQKRKGI